MTASHTSAVSVHQLSVHFGSLAAVDHVSFDLAAGSTLAVLGPSGSGKSTMLRAIAGLESSSSGSIELFGVDATDLPPHERRIGLMFQDHALFPHLDVAANVAFGLKMAGSPSVEQRTAEVLEMVGLAGFGRRSVDTLSGGEAQRVALARALAPSPRVLMLDEPLGSLDRVLREELVDELRALFADLDLAVLHVTHDQQEAFSLADRVLIMGEGRRAQLGRPEEVWHRPASVDIASFLGHPNLWSSTRSGLTILAPITALSIADDGDPSGSRADVISVEFREGRHRIVADEVDGERRRFVVDHDGPRPVGDEVRIAIDDASTVELADEPTLSGSTTPAER